MGLIAERALVPDRPSACIKSWVGRHNPHRTHASFRARKMFVARPALHRRRTNLFVLLPFCVSWFLIIPSSPPPPPSASPTAISAPVAAPQHE